MLIGAFVVPAVAHAQTILGWLGATSPNDPDDPPDITLVPC
jgi:hypothetical protein